ncbi:Nucleosome assembly protein (NAP) [Metarhizium robertsii ARSEF 23]|uniref:Nucleosome assembly protein (NAP) n=1 Tax=Metarhizium robertsii (strain ARSEF 23 / ATCC MYA-3075) TaxID=655844 RepID=E9F4Y0_METRA|nr:Nucleosome assembly protein (NAP) [Metarhizium robertsii ARSEF 23]EFY97312.1 Nucleosome assembly protein (NAP) [Metarhizium robertsii ARSEF 23]
MSVEDIHIPVMYEQLEDIQDDFDQVDVELMRVEYKLTRDLYAKREKVISQIPNFWPLVWEQAPPDIDEHIQMEDAKLIAASLKHMSVERFELPDGDPRSFAIKFEFSENEYFEDKMIEKKFWYRHGKDDFTGLVSEPVEIKWKPGKDLTKGLLTLAKELHEDDKAGKTGDTQNKIKLLKLKENATDDSNSFFNFFGFRGHYITEEESREVAKTVEEERKARQEGKEVEVKMDKDADGDVDIENDDDDDDDYEYEYKYDVFPPGANVALAIAEDLWPEAIRYFQEGAELAAAESDDDGADDEGGEMDEDEDEEKPSKKRKA